MTTLTQLSEPALWHETHRSLENTVWILGSRVWLQSGFSDHGKIGKIDVDSHTEVYDLLIVEMTMRSSEGKELAQGYQIVIQA